MLQTEYWKPRVYINGKVIFTMSNMLMIPQSFPFRINRVIAHFKKPLIILCLGQMQMVC